MLECKTSLKFGYSQVYRAWMWKIILHGHWPLSMDMKIRSSFVAVTPCRSGLIIWNRLTCFSQRSSEIFFDLFFDEASKNVLPKMINHINSPFWQFSSKGFSQPQPAIKISRTFSKKKKQSWKWKWYKLRKLKITENECLLYAQIHKLLKEGLVAGSTFWIPNIFHICVDQRNLLSTYDLPVK